MNDEYVVLLWNDDPLDGWSRFWRCNVGADSPFDAALNGMAHFELSYVGWIWVFSAVGGRVDFR